MWLVCCPGNCPGCTNLRGFSSDCFVADYYHREYKWFRICLVSNDVFIESSKNQDNEAILVWKICSINFHDMSPKYASLTVGLSNTIAFMPGLTSPVITGAIVKNQVI